MSDFMSLVRQQIINAYNNTPDTVDKTDDKTSLSPEETAVNIAKDRIRSKTEKLIEDAKSIDDLSIILYEELSCAYMSKYLLKVLQEESTKLSNYYFNRALIIAPQANMNRLTEAYENINTVTEIFAQLMTTETNVSVNNNITRSYSLALENTIAYVSTVRPKTVADAICGLLSQVSIIKLQKEAANVSEGVSPVTAINALFNTTLTKVLKTIDNGLQGIEVNGAIIKKEFFELADVFNVRAKDFITVLGQYEVTRNQYAGVETTNNIKAAVGALLGAYTTKLSNIYDSSAVLDESLLTELRLFTDLAAALMDVESQIGVYLKQTSEAIAILESSSVIFDNMFGTNSDSVLKTKTDIFNDIQHNVDSLSFDTTVTKNMWNLRDETALNKEYTDANMPLFYGTNELTKVFERNENDSDYIDNVDNLSSTYKFDELHRYVMNTEKKLDSISHDILTEDVLRDRLYYCDLLTNLTYTEFDKYTYSGIPAFSKLRYYYAALFKNTDQTNSIINTWMNLGYIKASDFSADFKSRREAYALLKSTNILVGDNYFQSRINPMYPLIFQSLSLVEECPVDKLLIEATDDDNKRALVYTPELHDEVIKYVAFFFFREMLGQSSSVNEKTNKFIYAVNTARNKTMKDIIVELGFVYILFEVMSGSAVDNFNDGIFTRDTLDNINSFLTSGDSLIYANPTNGGLKTRETTLKRYIDMILSSKNMTNENLSDVLEGIKENKRLKEVLGLREERYVKLPKIK